MPWDIQDDAVLPVFDFLGGMTQDMPSGELDMNDIKSMADLQKLLLSQKTHVSPNEISAGLSEMDLCKLAAGIARQFGAHDVFQYVFIHEGAQEARVITIGDEQTLVRQFGGSVVKALLEYTRKQAIRKLI